LKSFEATIIIASSISAVIGAVIGYAVGYFLAKNIKG